MILDNICLLNVSETPPTILWPSEIPYPWVNFANSLLRDLSYVHACVRSLRFTSKDTIHLTMFCVLILQMYGGSWIRLVLVFSVVCASATATTCTSQSKSHASFNHPISTD